MKVTLVALLVVAAGLAAAGCGGGSGAGDGDKTLDGDGYSFTYPGEWDEQDPVARYEGRDATSSAFVGQDHTNVLAAHSYALPVSITKDNIDDFAAELSEVRKEVYEETDGRLTAGPTPVTIDGLPGLRFEGSLVNVDGVRVQARETHVFDGKTLYYLYCQFTPEHAEEMQKGCDQVVESFEVE